jgi:hypothetical protein
MALVDPYAPCPCGSGQKFKWCCHKVEAHAEKAERLYDGGQIEAALHALDEGLRKVPENPWLMMRKAMILEQEDQPGQARPILEQLIARNPRHAGAQALLVRLVLELEGPVAAASQLQHALSAVTDEGRSILAALAELIAITLGRVDYAPAARAHYELAQSLGQGDASMVQSFLRLIESDPTISPWLRNPYSLSPAPERLEGTIRERFDQALEWANQGLWSVAAAAFDALSGEGAGPEADRNLALCRLWMADEEGAAEALGRYISQTGTTDDAVDLEALRQLIAPLGEDDQVDHMQLIWPLRDRQKLLEILRNDARSEAQGRGPIDPNDPESPEVDVFLLLDRPKPDPQAIQGPNDIPRIVGEALVGLDLAALSGYDDGGLDGLSDRFTTLAGPSIPPAHPKTKRIGRADRVGLKVNERWFLPPGVPRSRVTELVRQDLGRVIREVWARTPMSFLKGRTPEQAIRDGDAEVPLRAALNLLVHGQLSEGRSVELDQIREGLGLPRERALDPVGVDIDAVHLTRLQMIPAEQLDDERLLKLYARARHAMMVAALERAARALLERPHLIDSEEGIDRVILFTDLATIAIGRGDGETARALAQQGRLGDRPERRARNAPRWDMLDIRLRTRTDPPEDWVPQLAIVLERYRDHAEANAAVLSNLIDMGLIRLVPNPDRPGGMMVDGRPLQAVLGRYGPRITTASGGLGISATQGGIWTPEKQAEASGGTIWTPGSATAPTPTEGSAERPKLIIPGR